MELDIKFAIEVGVMLFGIGGAWAAQKTKLDGVRRMAEQAKKIAEKAHNRADELSEKLARVDQTQLEQEKRHQDAMQFLRSEREQILLAIRDLGTKLDNICASRLQ